MAESWEVEREGELEGWGSKAEDKCWASCNKWDITLGLLFSISDDTERDDASEDV